MKNIWCQSGKWNHIDTARPREYYQLTITKKATFSSFLLTISNLNMKNIRAQYGYLMTFGQSNYFKTGVTDGFMWRESYD